MPKIQIELNAEQDEKLKYFKDVFSLPSKRHAILKLIDLTKIKPLDKETEKDRVLKAFGEEV